MFLQIHFLTSYHATLLNRDDAGLAKRIPFGGAERLRVSSQCQKRHWTEYMRERSPLPQGWRTRHFFDRILSRRLIEKGVCEGDASQLSIFMATVLFSKKKSLKDWVKKGKTIDGILDKAKASETFKVFSSGKSWEEKIQVALFGSVESEYFSDLLVNLYKENQGDLDKTLVGLVKFAVDIKDNLDVLLRQGGYGQVFAGFEGALFGRFVTSDLLARVDAPIHVAHAITTHVLDTEVDFFTVVDDLNRDEETGAAHANDMELGAGIFYGYVAVDIPLLISNLTGCERQNWREQDPSDARGLLELLIQAIAQVSPGAKLGATAPYAYAEWILLEAGKNQPRSLANAWLQPLRSNAQTHPLAQSAVVAADYLESMERMYGRDEASRWVSSRHPWPRQSELVLPLPEAVEQALDHIFGAAS